MARTNTRSTSTTSASPAKRAPRPKRARDQRTLPVLPLADTVVYPDATSPLLVQREASVQLLDAAREGDGRFVLTTVRTPDIDDLDDVTTGDLHSVGVEVVVHRRIAMPDGTVRALVEATARVELLEPVQEEPYFTFRVRTLPDLGDPAADEVLALHTQLLQAFVDAIEHAPYLPDELAMVAGNVEDPAELCHLVASTIRFSVDDRQAVLAERDIHARQRLVLRQLSREVELLQLGARIHGEVHDQLTKSQREYFLRTQLEQIRAELGEDDEDDNGIRELREQIDAIEGLPDVARRAADRELRRLARTPEQSGEHGMIRTWLEWVAQLPWGHETTDQLGLEHAREILDRDHSGLDEVKERILDHLAVSQLTGGTAGGGAILCFVGPPGVGKTSLGRSIAAALGRQFARISVGGVRDEAEVRGHRRTYVGALPGTIVRALRDAGSRNPVFMVDEIDKMGSDWRGDPSSAMLEVLDPEQNSAFRDHYLDLPVDLSRALFICTANRLDTIPEPLRDRMEIIVIEGYTAQEKLDIARTHLLRRQLDRHGLTASRVRISVPALRALIEGWTHEAGVRELDRRIGTLARKAARRIAEGVERGEPVDRVKVGPGDLEELLGHQRYQPEQRRRTRRAGVCTGLAVTGAGGEILYVEAAATAGSGRLLVTGQVGSVMEESARAALTWLRGTDDRTGQDSTVDRQHDLHVHVPAGAIPKDGPSAGIAIATALASLERGLPVKAGLAMTGEVTLHGEVLPVGGIKQKVLAAQRAGIREIVLPDRNRGEAEEIPETLAAGMTFHFVEHADQVLELALGATGSSRGRRRPAT